MRAMTALEHRIVEIARGLGFLAELCNYIDYDPDVGPVKEHFRPRPEVLRLVEGLQLLDEPVSHGAAPQDGRPITWPAQPGTQRFIVEIDARKPLHRNEVLDALHRAHLALRTDIAVTDISGQASIVVHDPAAGEAPQVAANGMLLGAADNAAVHMEHCYQGEYAHSCKYGFDDCPAAPKGVQADASTLHQQIMNLPCNELHAGSPREDVQRAYGEGHKRARRDAAALVTAAFAGDSAAGVRAAIAGIDEGHMIYALLKKGYRVTRAEGMSQADLRERIEQLMLSYGSQCVEADRALREVRDGKDIAQSEVDRRNGLAQKAVDKLLGYFPDPQPATAAGATA